MFDNGSSLDALIDTGSVITTIDENIFNTLQIRHHEIPTDDRLRRLSAANNTEIIVSKTVRADISILGTNKTCDILIIPNISSKMIIGIDVIKKFRIVIKPHDTMVLSIDSGINCGESKKPKLNLN